VTAGRQLRKTLEPRLAAQNISVQWLDFPAGPQLVEALRAGSIDEGLTSWESRHTGQHRHTIMIFGGNAMSPIVELSSGSMTASGFAPRILKANISDSTSPNEKRAVVRV
jgi:hypothetical protein